MNEIRLVIASPSDVQPERDAADSVIRELSEMSELTGFRLSCFRWEVDSFPAFHPQGPQGLIDELAGINDCHILVGIFWRRLGTLVNKKDTGTQHEFKQAYNAWKRNGWPQIMLYFSSAGVPPVALTDADVAQLGALTEFRTHLPQGALPHSYDGPGVFPEVFKGHLKAMLAYLKTRPARPAPAADISPTPASIETLDLHEGNDVAKLEVPGAPGLLSSFAPSPAGGVFRRLRLATTPGIVQDRRQSNAIYVVRDPVRPFEIQIGENRARRPGGDPGFVALTSGRTLEAFQQMYPFIVDAQHTWLRLVFAELESNAEILRLIASEDPDPDVRRIATRNPSAPNDVKSRGCLFCSKQFIDSRVKYRLGAVSEGRGAVIFCNDFPYGPHFHYIVMPVAPVHSWEDVEEEHLRDMNMAVRRFLDPATSAEHLGGSVGIRIGFNSSIRHLVLGKTTHSSAGASVAHVHKQVWGMAPQSVNLADHLASICRAYRDADYLGSYLKALEAAKLVIWQDENVALYVPLGQIAVHELQMMVKSTEVRHYLDLSEEQIASVSRAEFIVSALYRAIGINSFNEILLSRPFDEDADDGFRLIFTFITREVDLAVSELSLLYVVDRHPTDTLAEVSKHWPEVEKRLGAGKRS